MKSFHAALLITLFTVSAACAQQEQRAVVRVNAAHSLEILPKRLFGSNLQWERNGDGLLVRAGETAEFDAKAMEALAPVRPSVLRFPGGTLADQFDWRAATGPAEGRGQCPGFDRKPQTIGMGIGEWIQLCRKWNADPLYTVNFNQPASEAAALVQYCNGPAGTPEGALRAQHGFPEPFRVRDWEIGNELYSAVEPGHCPAGKYVPKYLEIRRAMKAVDPGIRTGADFDLAFQQAPWVGRRYPYLLTWNNALAQGLGGELDFVSAHFYAPYDFNENPVRRAAMLAAAPTAFVHSLENLHRLFGRPVEVWVTEYNLFYDKPRFEYTAGIEGALLCAGLMIEMARSGVSAACHWSLLNNSFFGLAETGAGPARLRPAGRVMGLLRGLGGARIVRISVEAPTTDCPILGTVPTQLHTSVLRALAAASPDGRRLTLLLVHTGYTQPLAVDVEVQGFAAAQTARASSVTQKSDADESQIQVAGDGRMRLTLAPLSFTAVTLERAPAPPPPAA